MAAKPRNWRVLVVDDDPAVCGLLQALLEDREVTVTLATDADTALTLLGVSPPDLLIVDHLLGRRHTGLELVSAVNPDRTKVLLLTAHDADTVLSQYRQLGVVEVVSKPFRIDRLLGTVNRMLSRRGVL